MLCRLTEMSLTAKRTRWWMSLDDVGEVGLWKGIYQLGCGRGSLRRRGWTWSECNVGEESFVNCISKGDDFAMNVGSSAD